ncbi:TPA: hypothetical protein UM365_000548 [Stenotrophomonas maltophilia]|uniref:hypothetical protein n=1 Tax=Stenotrophomonas maltophilia TaxID=40324 RepID=UPI000DA2D561|nr:hypothetical protein [Stenotrophomonas maltophilia]MBH1878160.1 hypothetical protein [Stenotrophomonas maltophilia]SQG66904.1 Uncharacterised protein [Stenotrophomonas maltophilia]HEL4199734.1 hypothetical protein [Stenotrophomonas maltophilia]
MPYISVEVDLDEFDDDDIRDEYNARKLGQLAETNVDAGDHGSDLIVERAFLVARSMSQLPSEIKDLFWKVHGRAIP